MRWIRSLAMAGSIVALTLSATGCAGIGLTLFGVGAGTAVGSGASYTLDGIAYRTFTAPAADVRRATMTSLKRMDMRIKADEATDSGRTIVAQAGDRTVSIELERLTARTTRMRVTAKHNAILRDRATAGEIIAQTERALDDMPAVSRARPNG